MSRLRLARPFLLPLALGLLSGCAALADRSDPAPVATGRPTPAPARPVSSPIDNPTQDRMLSLPKQQQAAILAEAVGHGCTGVSPYYMGTGDGGSAIWSIRCARGHTWAVSIKPDATGGTNVMRCTSFTAETHLACFRKF